MSTNIKLTDDPYLTPYLDHIQRRKNRIVATERKLTGNNMPIHEFASGHEYYGLHLKKEGWVYREWAPNAESIYLMGDFNNWQILEEYRLNRINDNGDWEIKLHPDKIQDGDFYKIKVFWPGGEGERIPAYARRVLQDEQTNIFSAQVWLSKYRWKQPDKNIRHPFLKIYEAHIGMSLEKEGVASYDEFRRFVLPRIIEAGYNTIQLMGIQEHPYYGSFGYHVANYFAPSSRFGTPQDLKQLIDEAHKNNIAVIIDLIHSHSVKNEVEGLAKFDGTEYQYFHQGGRGNHDAWDSKLFDYGKVQVMHFLLSNCKYWIDEFRVDGFRLDGVTSMLYLHHGIMYSFTSYDDYFNHLVDEDAYTYLALANKVIHETKPSAVTIAEDISGMPGLAYDYKEGGSGFDYRLAMGVSDYWFKMLKDMRDEDWSMDALWHELTNRRAEEKTISYVESHDQALVGGKTLIFELADKEMYTGMQKGRGNIIIDRAISLHKLARLATFATAYGGYLNFMGNEFGHPEWIDFPREGNNWSYYYCRRQWTLRDNEELLYHSLAEFDKDMVNMDGTMDDSFAELRYAHNSDKVLAFRRGNYFFLFNFHPSESLSDYYIPVHLEGKFVLLMDSDKEQYSGFSRLLPNQEYYTVKKEGDDTSYVKVYLPSRSALVIEYMG